MAYEDTFDLGEKIAHHKLEFKVCPDLWKDGDFISDHISFDDVQEIKYLNDTGSILNADNEALPTNGGLYFFYIKPTTFPEMTSHLVYIGRAQKTVNQNLRKRCKSYFQKYCKEDERPKIARMIKQYGKYLYLRYIDLGDDNDLIVELEAKLINNLLPPFNDEIPSKVVRDAIKAFV